MSILINRKFPVTVVDGSVKDSQKAFDRVRDWMLVLRQTLSSYVVIGGANIPIIAKVFDHKSQASTAIYTRLSNDPVLEAVNQASALIQH